MRVFTQHELVAETREIVHRATYMGRQRQNFWNKFSHFVVVMVVRLLLCLSGQFARCVVCVCVCVLWFFIDSYYCVVASCVSKIVAQTQRRLLRDQNNLPQKFIIIRAIFTLPPEPISIKKFCDVFHFPLFFLFFLLSLWLFLGSCISHSDTFAWCLRHMYVSSFRLPLPRVSNDSCQFPVDAFCRTDASFPFSPIACSYSSLQILISFNWGLRWYVRRDGLREMFFSAIMSAAFMINASVLFTVCTSGVCVCVLMINCTTSDEPEWRASNLVQHLAKRIRLRWWELRGNSGTQTMPIRSQSRWNEIVNGASGPFCHFLANMHVKQQLGTKLMHTRTSTTLTHTHTRPRIHHSARREENSIWMGCN